MWYGLLADAIVGFHVAYVAYVLFGQLLILVGLALGWSWVRNPWFRWSHLLMICIVALESIGNVQCPLTIWEYDLRKLAGQKIDQEMRPEIAAQLVGPLGHPQAGPIMTAFMATNDVFEEPTFIGRLLHDVLIIDLPFGHPIFKFSYISFAVAVVATFLFAPPRPFRARKEKAGQESPALEDPLPIP